MILAVYFIGFFCCLLGENFKDIHKRILLICMCVCLTLCVGFRSLNWPDTYTYMKGFTKYTNNLFDYSFADIPLGYNDKGFYLLSACIKTITADYQIFFICISGLTFLFLYKSLVHYSIYPLLGLIVYMSRFFVSRNMMQIRAALAIALVVYALQYVSKQELKKFLLIVSLAFTLHFSMVLAIPLYWMNKLEITSKWITYGIIGAFIIAFLFSGLVVDKITMLSLQYDLATTYTNETSGYTIGKGLANPMIYYQTILLLIFTYNESSLQNRIPYYRTIRNGYFYSTLVLILFSSFSALSGRTSTIYATFEIFILPSFLLLFPKQLRMVGYCGFIIVASLLFYLYYTPYSIL